jgi:hypothetical protein
VCTNTPGSRTCACAAGFTGDGFTCADVNECLTNNGGCAATTSGGVCTNTPGSRTCACATGWTGNGLTCADVNECATNNGGCSTNATCTNTPGSRTCACNAGYAGNGVTCTPNGDSCAAPIALTLNTAFNGTTVGATNDIATPLSQLCDGASYSGPDTVHVFTPATTGTFRVTTTGFSGFRVWVGSACGTSNSCFASLPENASSTAFNFRGTAGTPVYLVVDSTSGSGAYSLTVSTVTAATNDTCMSAAPLTLGTPVSSTFSGAVNDVTPLASCGNPAYTQPEVVYAFTPTVTGGYVLRETTSSDVVLWISSTCDGACQAFVDDPENLQTTLNAGTTYFFFVEPYATATTFTLQLDQILAPPNDTCSAPAALPVSTTVMASTLGATNDYAGPLSAACSALSMPGADTVYSFTPAASGSFIVNLTGSTDVWVSSTCGDGASCSAVESATVNNVVFRGTAGTPVFLTVDSTNAGTNDFGISVDPVTAPANDTCATAQTLTLATPVSGTTAGAADDVNPVAACGDNRRAGDVVFSFTPPATGQYLVRETSTSDVVLWLSSACDGTCSAWTDAPEEIVFTGTAGVPQLIFLEPYGTRGAYTLEVISAAPPANDTCAAPQALSLGVPVNATTTIATNDYDGLSAACYAIPAPGRDLVYSFTPASSGNFSITATGSPAPLVWTSPTCGVAASCTWASAGPQVVRGSAGTPFFVTVDGVTSGSSGSFTLTLSSVAAPANDLCSGATPMTVNTPISTTTVGAVNDVRPIPACTPNPRTTGDVVFTFTPPTSGTWFFHETTASDVVMWVGTACDGSCLAYVDDPEDLSVNLTAGVPYYFVVKPYSTPGPITVVVSTN